jgi:hypothetical protein
MQKSKLLIIVTLFVAFVSIGFNIYLIGLSNDLGDTIKEKNNIIKNGLKSNQNEISKLSDTVRTITEKISYELGGRKLTTDDMIKMYNYISSEKDKYKLLYDIAKEKYGFRELIEKKGNQTTYSFKDFTRADSSLVTYDLFKNRIYFKNGNWYGDVTSKKDLEKYDKDIANKIRELTKPKPIDTTKQN